MIKATLILTLSALVFGPVAIAQTRKAASGSREGKSVSAPAAGEQVKAPADNKPESEAKPASSKTEDCGCDGKLPPDTIAVVNGVRVSTKEIDDTIKDKVQELQKQVIDSRKRELDLQINSRLLEAEAKKRGISSTKLIEMEITAKALQPTEAEAQAFYNQNKERITGAFNDVKGEIIKYLIEQRKNDLAAAYAQRLRGQSKLVILASPDSITAPSTPAERARVLATVNGENISAGDIENSLAPAIFNVQEQVYQLRKGQLEMRINDLLLEQEAHKRQITSKALYDTEVASKAKPVTEADAKKFYDENKERITGDFAQLKDRVIEYLRQQQEQELERTFAEGLRKAASVQINLPLPDVPVLKIAVDDQPIKGDANALVTLIEFTDFECPSCAKTQPLLEEVLGQYPGRVRLVVRDFPLEQHKHALKAAEAAECAREQGKYWEYADLMFKNQSALEIEKLKEYASQLGLNRTKFDASLDSGKYSDKVQRDVLDGYSLGVDSTPTVFINGKRIRERTKESLKEAIDSALKETAK